MKNLIHTLVSIANKCDESGLYKEAEKLDSIIKKLSSSGTPVGRPYRDKNGVMIQTYITPNGKTIKAPVDQKEKAPIPAEKEEGLEGEESSFFERYSPFDKIIKALNPGEEVPTQNPQTNQE